MLEKIGARKSRSARKYGDNLAVRVLNAAKSKNSLTYRRHGTTFDVIESQKKKMHTEASDSLPLMGKVKR